EPRPQAPVSLALLDRDADQRAPLGPGAVVVLDVPPAQQLVQGEPYVRAPLPDPAVRDDVLVGGHPLLAVEGHELIRGLEGAVLVRRLAPGDVCGAGDVAGHLGLLLRKVVGGELLTPELLRGADVDEGALAELL